MTESFDMEKYLLEMREYFLAEAEAREKRQMDFLSIELRKMNLDPSDIERIKKTVWNSYS